MSGLLDLSFFGRTEMIRDPIDVRNAADIHKRATRIRICRRCIDRIAGAIVIIAREYQKRRT